MPTNMLKAVQHVIEQTELALKKAQEENPDATERELMEATLKIYAEEGELSPDSAV